jgi:hypothetical protein
MRQVILLDTHDVTTLKSGTPMRVQLVDGTVLEIAFERMGRPGIGFEPPRVGRLVERNGPAPSAKPPKPCPYCDSKVRTLGPHIRQRHPGKGLVAKGGVKCRWCPKRFPNRVSVLRHEVMAHREHFPKKKKEAAQP